MMVRAVLLAAPRSAASQDASVLFLAAFLFLGGCLQLLAAVMGIRRRGEFKTTQGRQLSALLGRRGAIAFWLVLGIVLVLAGLALGLSRLTR